MVVHMMAETCNEGVLLVLSIPLLLWTPIVPISAILALYALARLQAGHLSARVLGLAIVIAHIVAILGLTVLGVDATGVFILGVLPLELLFLARYCYRYFSRQNNRRFSSLYDLIYKALAVYSVLMLPLVTVVYCGGIIRVRRSVR